MTKVQYIAVSLPDSSVAVMQMVVETHIAGFDPEAAKAHGFSASDAGWSRTLTDEQIAAEISRTIGLSPNNGWRRVDPMDLPQDRTFRDAWVDDGRALHVDMPKARVIAHRKRREKRETEMAPLDAQINIAAANPGKIAATEAKRQAVRDRYAVMQDAIDKASNVAELHTALA